MTNQLEEPSREHVDTMFNDISPTYDKVNRLMTFGLDQYWRKAVSRHLPINPIIDLLDLATGTADQILAIVRNSQNIRSIVGVDFAEEMLYLARKKMTENNLNDKVKLIKGDALSLPFPDHSFDCVTMAFGIRNVLDVSKCLIEMKRVLRPHGKALILECSVPTHPLLKRIYYLHIRHLLPLLGGWISGNKNAYVYLNRTAETFPCGDAFCSLLKSAGFSKTTAHPMTFGAVTLYEAGCDGNSPQ